MNSDQILIHGLIYSGGFSLIVLISVLINPRIWLQDFPDHLKNEIPPKSSREVKQTFITGFLFALFIIAFPLYSISEMMNQADFPLSFLNLFMHSFYVMMICNILYWLIVDLIIFNFIINYIRKVPGLDKKIRFSGWRRQFFGMLVGVVSCILISGFIATVASFFV